MRGVLHFDALKDVAEYIDEKVIAYIDSDTSESFESFENFSVFAFDWYDIEKKSRINHKITVYLDREDLFFFCSDDESYENATVCYNWANEDNLIPNDLCLYRFFSQMLKDDMNILDKYELMITDVEDDILDGADKECLAKIIEYRRELLQLKRYYTQLVVAFSEFESNENGLLSGNCEHLFSILSGRADRLCTAASSLRDYVAQVREAYQSQIDIALNGLMKVFTVIAAIFLPLTLIVGWYGMNFKNMPELSWKWGYPVVIALSIAVAGILLVAFKKKKYF